MADNTFSIKLVLSDDNKLSLATNQIKQLGGAVSDTNKVTGNLFNTMEKGVIGTANSTKSFSKLAQTIQGSSGVVGAYATLAANVFAISAAFQQLKSAAQLEQVFRGLSSAGARSGVALDVVANKLQSVTNNTIDLQQAYTATARTFAAGFSTKQILAIGQAANDASYALGQNETDTLNRIVSGVEKLRPQLLAQIGIFTTVDESSANYARQLGKTVDGLSAVEKRQGYLNAVLDEAKLKFGGLADDAGDSRVYNQLGATFTNLKNTVLGFINEGVTPLISVLGSNPTALGGAALLFASTISNKLLPGVDKLQDRTAAAIKGNETETTSIRQKTEALQIQAAAAKASAVSAAVEHVEAFPKSGKIYASMVQGIQEGTIAAEAGIRTLTTDLSILEGQYKKMAANPNADAGKLALKKDLINTVREQIEVLKQLQEAEQTEAKVALSQATERLQLQYEELASAQGNAYLKSSSNALALAAEGKYRDSIGQTISTLKEYKKVLAARQLVSDAAAEKNSGAVKEPEPSATVTTGTTSDGNIPQQTRADVDAYKASRTEYLESLKIAKEESAALGDETLSLGNKFKLAGVAASEFGKVAKVIFLNALPVIGQVIFAVGLLESAIEFLKPDSVKNLEKAFSDFDDIIKDVDKSIESQIRLQTSSANITLRTAQAITTQSNSINTLVEAYDDIIAKQQEFDKAREDGTKSGPSSYLSGLVSGGAKQLSNATGLDLYNKAVLAGQKFVKITDIFGTDKGLTKATDTLGRLIVEAPEATDKLVNLQGGWDRLNNSATKESFEASVHAIADGINSQFKDAASNVQELTDAFKNLDESITDWSQASKQATPFDKIVDNFRGATNTITKFQNAAAKQGGTEAANTYKNLLANIGTSTSAFFSSDTKKALDGFNDAADHIQKVQAAIAVSSGDQKKALQDQLPELQRQLTIKSSVLDAVKRELDNVQAQYELAQKQSREYKSQETYLQAVVAANQANTSTTAEGVIARVDAENRIKSLQVDELTIQINLQKLYISQYKTTVNRLDAEATSIENAVKLNTQLSETDLRQKRIGAQLRENAAIDALNKAGVKDKNAPTAQSILLNPVYSVNSPYAALIKEFGQAHQLGADIDTILSDKSASNAARQQIDAARSAIKTSTNERNSQVVSMTNAEQKQAEAESKRVENINAITAKLSEQAKIVASTQLLEEQTNKVLQGRSLTLADQLDDIRKNAEESRRELDASYSSSRATQLAQLQEARGNATKATNPEDKRAALTTIGYLQTQLDLEDRGYQINLQQLDAQTKSQVAAKVAFDTQKEGLTMQQQALENLTKQVDARRQLSDSIQSLYSVQVKLAHSREGFATNEYSDQQVAIRAAEQAFKFAVEEANIKKATIDLEYALLDAQRQKTLGDLAVQKGALEQLDGTKEQVAQINATIANLSKFDSSQARDAAKKNVDVGVDKARIDLEQATQYVGTRFALPLLDELKVFEDHIKADLTARNALSNASTFKAINVTAASVDPRGYDIKPIVNPVVDSNKSLSTHIDSLSDVIKEWLAKNSTSVPVSNTMSAQQVADAVAAKFGVTVTSTLRAPGQAGNLGDKSNHVHDRAFDIAPKSGVDYAEIVKFIDSLGKVAARYLPEVSKAAMAKYGATGPNIHFDWKNVQSSVKAGAEEGVREGIKNTSSTSPSITSPQKSSIFNETPKAVASASQPIDIADNLNSNISQVKPPSDLFSSAISDMSKFNELTVTLQSNLDNLGNNGQVLKSFTSGMESIGAGMSKLTDSFKNGASSTTELVQGLQVVSSALTTVESISDATAKGVEDGIQRQIDAEEKRDGKSQESLAKIDALNKKKDQVAKKSFDTNKKLMMANAVIGTAAGVAQALGSLPPPANIILATAIGAMGLAEVAIIAGTQYESSYTPASVAPPDTLSIGAANNSTVDLAKQNNNVGGELGYIHGTQGYGNSASTYSVIGSAYGGDLPRGYGNTAYIVGEKGPETIVPMSPMRVVPSTSNDSSAPVNATFHIHAMDGDSVERVLKTQKGNIISMIREAANANGQPFLENVSTSSYSRPNDTGNTRL